MRDLEHHEFIERLWQQYQGYKVDEVKELPKNENFELVHRITGPWQDREYYKKSNSNKKVLYLLHIDV